MYCRIDRQNEIIMNASRVVAETEEVGETLLEELSNNREKIESSQAKVFINVLSFQFQFVVISTPFIF